MYIYAVYRGDKFLYVGTLYEVAHYLNVKIGSVKYYADYRSKLNRRDYDKNIAVYKYKL